MSEVTIEQFNELKAKLASFEKEHEAFKSVHVSRRGVEGPRGKDGVGIQGTPGQSITGPAGRPGKDANVTDCVEAAKAAFQSEIATLHSSVAGVVTQALKDAGVINQAGKAILVTGPAGQNGKDSTAVGPAGASVTGPAGANGKDARVAIGTVTSGSEAAARVRVVDGISFIDLVLPQGARGQAGADSTVAGPQGIPGKDSDVTQEMQDFRDEINSQVGQISGQLENRFRRIAKLDIAAALRGHLNESHLNDNK